MTIYKPLKQLAETAAEYAVKMAHHRPIIARGSIDNGKVTVPTVQVGVIAVTKQNMRDTVIKDGFHTEQEIYGQMQEGRYRFYHVTLHHTCIVVARRITARHVEKITCAKRRSSF